MADVRVVSATNRDLLRMVEAGEFRADLYYRIAGIKVTIPPLRERRTDIPAMAEALLNRLHDPRKLQCHLTDESLQKLKMHDYPGNVRELKNILLQAVSLTTNGVITPDLINLEKSRRTTEAAQRRHSDHEKLSIKDMESRHISDLLTQHHGHRRKVADELGISERTLYRKIDRYNLGNAGK